VEGSKHKFFGFFCKKQAGQLVRLRHFGAFSKNEISGPSFGQQLGLIASMNQLLACKQARQ